MGWLFSPRWATRAEMLAHLRRPERFSPSCKLLRSQAVGNNHWFLASNFATGKVFIGLDLMAGSGRSREGWGYKDLDESVGPCEVNCPISYLAQASDPVGYAVEWREKVRAYHAARRSRIAPTEGLIATYDGVTYKLISHTGSRRDWNVLRISDGMPFRMNARQVAQAVVAKNDKPTATPQP